MFLAQDRPHFSLAGRGTVKWHTALSMCSRTDILIPSDMGSLSWSALKSRASRRLYSPMARTVSAHSKASAHESTHVLGVLAFFGRGSRSPQRLARQVSLWSLARGG